MKLMCKTICFTFFYIIIFTGMLLHGGLAINALFNGTEAYKFIAFLFISVAAVFSTYLSIKICDRVVK